MGTSALEPASANQAAANAAADAIRATGTSAGARAISQLPPLWRAWLAKAFGLTCEVGQSPLTFMSDTDLFSQPPSLLEDTVESARHPDWGLVSRHGWTATIDRDRKYGRAQPS